MIGLSSIIRSLMNIQRLQRYQKKQGLRVLKAATYGAYLENESFIPLDENGEPFLSGVANAIGIDPSRGRIYIYRYTPDRKLYPYRLDGTLVESEIHTLDRSYGGFDIFKRSGICSIYHNLKYIFD